MIHKIIVQFLNNLFVIIFKNATNSLIFIIIILTVYKFKISMNKSSFLSQNSQKHTSSFLNQSINASKQCCQYKEKYEVLYKQMSQIRIQLRSIKQQNNSLRLTLKGTQDQNSTLKNLLSTKKELINKLNYEIRESNEEINRLEDYNNILLGSNQQLVNKHGQFERQLKELEEKLKRQREEKRLIVIRCQQKQREILKNKENCEKIQRMHKQQNSKNIQDIGRMMNEQIESILEVFMKSNHIFPQNKQSQDDILKISIQQALASSSEQNNKAQNISPQKNMPKPNFKVKNFKITQNNSNSFNLMSFQNKLSAFNQTIQQKYKEQQKFIQLKESEIKSQKQKIQHLQNQLQESMELFQQQLNDIQGLKSKLKEKQIANATFEKANTQRNMEKEDFFKNATKKLIYILQNSIVHENIDIFTKLNCMMEQGNAKKFEFQILIREIQRMAEDNFKDTVKLRLNHSNLQTLTRQYNQISEQYELILLKYSTLQREYNQILQDNNRLIKFNHLSKFRINRNNLSPYKQKQHQNSKTPINLLKKNSMSPHLKQNKQNLQSTINK